MINLKGTYQSIRQAYLALVFICLVPSFILAENIGLFYHKDFVEVEDGNVFAEASNLKASLEYLGHEVTIFDDFDLIATTNIDIVIIPELEKRSLAASLSSTQMNTYKSYVEKGGGVIVMGVVASESGNNSNGVDFINRLYGCNLGIGNAVLEGTCIKNSNIPENRFVEAPNSIDNNNATVYIERGYPEGSQVLYYNQARPSEAAVVQFTMGNGSILYFGWGWWNSFPIGEQDGGWLALLKSSIETIACHSPSLNVESSYTFPLELNGSFTLDDSFFDESYTACTDAELSLSKSVFSCEDIDSENPIEIKITDEIGRSVSQTVNIVITDENEVCEVQSLSSQISGSVLNIIGVPLMDVNLILESEVPQYYTSNQFGNFSMSLNLQDNYILHLDKEAPPAREVTSNDLRLLNRHILGLEEFTSPYQYLAADMNGDLKLDVEDLMIIKKLILHQEITEKFPSNWFWVAGEYSFNQDLSPLEQPWDGLQESQIDLDNPTLNIIGIKAGDIDGSIR